MAWTVFMWLRIEKLVGCFEFGNEPASSLKSEGFLY